MSANTSIKEGGKARSFGPVKALMVQGDDGNYLPWVPESERQLDTKSANKNGVYQAKKNGVYGWRSVSVNVPTDQGVTGKDPETGQQVAVGVDPTTGELTETVVPVEIRVTTVPTKTEYTDGEIINYSGLVVHAYDANGADMGEVPFNELVLPVTIADVVFSEWTDGGDIHAEAIYYTPAPSIQGISYVSKPLGTRNGLPAAYGSEQTPAHWLMTRFNGENYGYVITGDGSTNGYVQEQTEDGLKWGLFAGSTQIHASTFAWIPLGDVMTSLPSSSVDPTTIDPSTLHAAQLLPVQWSRPGDGAVLETSFEINVTSAGGD